jgi:hypothetical protein
LPLLRSAFPVSAIIPSQTASSSSMRRAGGLGGAILGVLLAAIEA